jgi:hypothetical protein
VNFIAHDEWSLIWLAALCVAGLITVMGRKRDARRILAVMVVNWLCTRLVVTFAPHNDFLWQLSDAVACIGMAAYGRTKAAYAVASLFFIILLFDTAMILKIAAFPQIAAISDALGFLMLTIMAGAAHGNNGRRSLHHGVNRRGFGNLYHSVTFRSEHTRGSRHVTRGTSQTPDNLATD